jgi:DNA/RNA non-specific endonuclease
VMEWIDNAIDTSKSPAENTAGIIEQAKDFGASILTGIAEWVATQVATEIATLAAAAAASGGLSEVLDVIRRIYKAILSAVRWARQILDMVNQTLDDITTIASGNIEAAGAKLEQVMHQGMPVVIGFLADQVGLGGIGTAIKDIITPLRAAVDKALNWLIDKLKGGIKGLIGAAKAGVAKLVEWWKQSEQFTTNDGATHSLYFSGQDEQAKLTIASNPEDYEAFIQKISTSGKSEEFKKAHGQALAIAQEISQKQAERQFDEEARQKKAEFIQKKLKALAKPTKILASLTGDNQPPSVISYGSLTSEGGATSMDAKILSKNHPEGSGPSDNPAIWQKANRRNGIFVQGHLLNDNIGGPGRMYNLTPITRSANGTHHSHVEKDVKDAVLKDKEVVRYKVIVNYDKHSMRSTHKNLKIEYKDLKNKIDGLSKPNNKDISNLAKIKEKSEIMNYEEKYLATSLTAVWGTLEHDGSKWKNKENKSPVTISNDLPDSEPDI